MRTALPLPTAKSQTEIADLGWIHLASAIAHDAEGDCHPVSHKLLIRLLFSCPAGVARHTLNISFLTGS